MNTDRAQAPDPDDYPPPPSMRFNPEDEVTPAFTEAMLREQPGAVMLLDCRTPEEHTAASIAGAVLIPMAELGARIEEVWEHLERGEQQRVIVHCHHGVRSLTVTHALRQAGVEPVHSMIGGIDAWSVHIDPSVPRY